MDAVFGDDTSYKWGYLTKQSAAWAVLGVNFGSKFQPSDLVKESDKMFVVAYPSFNPRGELIGVYKQVEAALQAGKQFARVCCYCARTKQKRK